MWLFEERQQLTGFWIIVAVVITVSAVATIFPFWIEKASVSVNINLLLLIISIDIVMIATITVVFRFLRVRMNEERIEFGYAPFIVKIPLDQIKSVRLVKHTIWQSGGIGLRLGRGRRWCYTARLGPAIEIDWGAKRRHAFSVYDYEGLAMVLKDFLGNRFSNMIELKKGQ